MPCHLHKGDLVWLGAVVLTLAAIPALSSRRRGVPHERCIATIRQIHSALEQYAIDYDDHLPNASWMDRLTPTYLKRDHPAFHCPVEGHYGAMYALNAELLGKSPESLTKPEVVPLIFDSTNLERNALSTNSDFSTRHNGLGYVCFVQGPVGSLDAARFEKLLKP